MQNPLIENQITFIDMEYDNGNAQGTKVIIKTLLE